MNLWSFDRSHRLSSNQNHIYHYIFSLINFYQIINWPGSTLVPVLVFVHHFQRAPANGTAMLAHWWILYGKWYIRQLNCPHWKNYVLVQHDEWVVLNHWRACYTIYRCRLCSHCGRAYVWWDRIADYMISSNVGI